MPVPLVKIHAKQNSSRFVHAAQSRTIRNITANRQCAALSRPSREKLLDKSLRISPLATPPEAPPTKLDLIAEAQPVQVEARRLGPRW